jgi:dipeptidyl aminopeptidase/acylaminoacyl peptidase
LDADGRPAGAAHFPTEPAEYFGPRVSPDGARLAYRLGSPDRSSDAVVRIADTRTGDVEKLVGAGIESAPVWTPDGRYIIGTGSGGELRFADALGEKDSGTLLSADGARRIPWSIDAAGGRLAFYQRGATEAPVTFDLWTVPIAIGADTISAGGPEPLVISDYFEVYPSLSPDGRWVAYTSLESGAYEIYVRAVAGEAPKVRVSDRGGIAAAWSRDGRRIFYQSTDQRLMVVDLHEVEDRLEPSAPRLFSEVELADTGVAPSFDVAPDGRAVALVAPPDAPPEQRATNVTVVIDVFAALRRSETN